jgi:hypothetical protein
MITYAWRELTLVLIYGITLLYLEIINIKHLYI